MIDYHVTRLFLGVAEAVVSFTVLRKNVGYCFGFGVSMFFSATYHISPSFPRDAAWKYAIQTPYVIALLWLTIAATLEIFAFLKRKTFPRERGLLFTASAAIGVMPVMAGWIWHPENPYQALMIARQYVLIGFAAGYASAWTWVTCVRPVKMSASLRAHGRLWRSWLIVSAALSSTAKGGLWWRLFDWSGGERAWSIGSSAMMLAQIFLCVLFVLNLRKWRCACAAPTARCA